MNDGKEQRADWRAGLSAACERLVHPDVTGDERERQARLIGVLLVAPILAGTLIGQLLGAASLAAYVLSALCLTFVLSWTGVVIIAQSGRTGLVMRLAPLVLGLMLALALAAGGMLQSPLLFLIAVPPLEAWFIWRERRAALAGGVISVAALALAAGAGLLGWLPASGFAGHLWVTPLAYAATLILRFNAAPAIVPASPEIACDALARITGSFVARVNRQGNVLAASDDSEALLGVQPMVLLGPGLFERLQVTDRVAYLAGIDAAFGGKTGAAIEVRLRMAGVAGPGEYCCCRLSLALAGEDWLFVIAERLDLGETAEAPRPARLLRIDEHRAGHVASETARDTAADADGDQIMELTELGHEQKRRFA